MPFNVNTKKYIHSGLVTYICPECGKMLNASENINFYVDEFVDGITNDTDEFEFIMNSMQHKMLIPCYGGCDASMFKCDQKLAPTISKLIKDGILTFQCCEGHIGDVYDIPDGNPMEIDAAISGPWIDFILNTDDPEYNEDNKERLEKTVKFIDTLRKFADGFKNPSDKSYSLSFNNHFNIANFNVIETNGVRLDLARVMFMLNASDLNDQPQLLHIMINRFLTLINNAYELFKEDKAFNIGLTD